MSVVIETSLGNLAVDLAWRENPQAATNFVKLCQMKSYNYSSFATVQSGFIAEIQMHDGSNQSAWYSTGQDTNKWFARDLSLLGKPKLSHTRRGTVSMTAPTKFDTENTAAKVHGSKFFITFGNDMTYLDVRHTIVGHVVLQESESTLLAIESVVVDRQTHRPIQELLIRHTYVLHDPFPDFSGMQVSERSPSPPSSLLEYVDERIAEHTTIDWTLGQEEKLQQTLQRKLDTRTKAVALELLGDLPNADIKPPENILFVANLNPMTRDKDLRVIFQRYGRVRSCDIIRDRNTEKSLRYAFVEFNQRADAEAAYSKMQGAFIDDRKVTVDFSQSVSRMADEWRANRRDKN